jgi:hypothetical protein
MVNGPFTSRRRTGEADPSGLLGDDLMHGIGLTGLGAPGQAARAALYAMAPAEIGRRQRGARHRAAAGGDRARILREGEERLRGLACRRAIARRPAGCRIASAINQVFPR